MTLPSGTRLGPYEILSPLGAGGMGEVYKGRDTRLDRTVAIKVLPEQLASDRQFRERFEREARSVGSLNHPHICTLHEVGRHDGVDFLVMEHLEGETLEQRLQRRAGPFGPAGLPGKGSGRPSGLPMDEVLQIEPVLVAGRPIHRILRRREAQDDQHLW